MAGRKPKVDDERKSYSAVFLLGVGLLLVGAGWAVWDDQISRRPWKKYQFEFSEIQIDRARQAVADEDRRLAGDPEYQRVVQELAEAHESLREGGTARRLAKLQEQQAAARVRVDDGEFELRVVKSKIEEAWYAYEHAMLTGAPTEDAKAQLDRLHAEKKEVESRLAQAEGPLQQIESETTEIRSVIAHLEKKRLELEQGRQRLQQRLDGLVLTSFAGLDLPKIPKIRQVVMGEFDRNNFGEAVARVDRCESCHSGVNKAGFDDEPHPYATHPYRKVLLGNHRPERFGCTPCHDGQGVALNSTAQAHGEVKHWDRPLRRGDMIQASCLGCHLNTGLPHAETLTRGEQLFEQLGCIGCHLVEGYGDLPKPGPYLRRTAAKLRPAWLVEWVQDPQSYRPHTRMPNFSFTRQQASAIAGYLLSASDGESNEWLAGRELPAGIDADDPALVAQGEQLANSLGCRGCHGFAPGESPGRLTASKDIAPNLSDVASKTDARWLYHWLLNPRGYSPEARMPSLRLSDYEARALVSYLSTLGAAGEPDPKLKEELVEPGNVSEGAALIRKYGCAGCHDIPGMEAESRIGVELTTFGSKPTEELFFGSRADIPHTWYDWTYNKLKDPRTYATERIEQTMPQVYLSDVDAAALMVFLGSLVEGKVPEKYRARGVARERALQEGRRIAQRYNCFGCHVIEGQGGAILGLYEDDPNMGPPILNGEGAKVQPNWLFGFLQRPITLRPWLKVRMPTFGLSDEEAYSLVEYFTAQEHVEIPFVYVNEAKMTEEYVEAGRKLASDEYFSCFSCHQQGDRKPDGPEEGWAPDLALARERLEPSWIAEWIRNPQALEPGTSMPSFYDFSDSEPGGPDDILGGDDEKQVLALRDYILTLRAAADEADEPLPGQVAAAGADGAGQDGM